MFHMTLLYQFLEKSKQIDDFLSLMCYNAGMDKKVFRLAQLFEPYAKLYLVGGAVRNQLLGLPIQDYDIVSSLTPEQLSMIDGIEINIINASLGAARIIFEGSSYDYTTFRTESYDKLGKHSPNQVQFTDSLKEDSKRRDFTINAIYYNILEDKYIDFYGGIDDVKNHVLRALPTPMRVLSEDGARIWRLVRFCLQYDFTIEQETLNAARANLDKLQALSDQRAEKEKALVEITAKNKSIFDNADTLLKKILKI